MSDQTVHTPAEAKGKPVMVGDRGGLKTKDGLGNKSSSKDKQPQMRIIAPLSILVGDGYDIAFFAEKGGYTIRYKGPKALEKIAMVKEEYHKSRSIIEAINKVR